MRWEVRKEREKIQHMVDVLLEITMLCYIHKHVVYVCKSGMTTYVLQYYLIITLPHYLISHIRYTTLKPHLHNINIHKNVRIYIYTYIS